MHIVDPQSYSKSKWLNGKGETTQLLINPSNQDFKQQAFDYRISIASLNAELCQFSNFENYNRWLVLLEGGPVNIKNSTREENIELQPLKHIISFGGEEVLSSISQKQGLDFNFFLKKGLKGQAKLHHFKNNIQFPICKGIHLFYNTTKTAVTISTKTQSIVIQYGTLCHLSAEQDSSLQLISVNEATLIHCTIII